MTFVPNNPPPGGSTKGALVGGGIGFLGAGIFGAIPGALIGYNWNKIKGMFQMNHADIQQAYQPQQLGYPHVHTQDYGGHSMPNSLFGHTNEKMSFNGWADFHRQLAGQTADSRYPHHPPQPMVVQEQPQGSGAGTALAVGAGAGVFGLPLMASVLWGGLGLGGFNWFAI